jgi:hypothetical protein
VSKIVSVLLPTRGRVKKLAESLESLERTVTNIADVEVLVRVDIDDPTTFDFLTKQPHKFDLGVIHGPRGNGYADLHLMYNRLCEVSKGRFLFLWNDDATMLTPGWDVEIGRHDDGKPCYVTSKLVDSRGRDNWLFPIVHRTWFEATGHFSMSPHNDTYVYNAFRPFPQLFRPSNVTIQHHALELIKQNDQTSADAQKWWPTTKKDWDSPQVQQALASDIAKLRGLVNKDP